MTNAERIFKFICSRAPNRVTNADLKTYTGIRPHAQIFQITQRLVADGQIRGRQVGKEWEFWVDADASEKLRQHPTTPPSDTSQVDSSGCLSPREFEKLSRRVMSEYFRRELQPGTVGGVPKRFDLVSEDCLTVGDAKYYSMVQGERIPPAKFSVIAEYVWFLEKAEADNKFLVFGNDRRVPEQWLNRYGQLLEGVRFYFIDEDGTMSELAPTQ